MPYTREQIAAELVPEGLLREVRVIDSHTGARLLRVIDNGGRVYLRETLQSEKDAPMARGGVSQLSFSPAEAKHVAALMLATAARLEALAPPGSPAPGIRLKDERSLDAAQTKPDPQGPAAAASQSDRGGEP